MKVLIAEDEAISRTILKRITEKTGRRVAHRSKGFGVGCSEGGANERDAQKKG